MTEYSAKYIVSKNNRRIGEINVRYTANNDDESIRIARSVCEKLGEEDVEELTIEKIVGATAGTLIGASLSNSDEDKLLGTIAGIITGVYRSYCRLCNNLR
ncbi:hypothetical protein YN1HA_25920 [Sulfurisphaera ohwakuensis]